MSQIVVYSREALLEPDELFIDCGLCALMAQPVIKHPVMYSLTHDSGIALTHTLSRFPKQ